MIIQQHLKINCQYIPDSHNYLAEIVYCKLQIARTDLQDVSLEHSNGETIEKEESTENYIRAKILELIVSSSNECCNKKSIVSKIRTSKSKMKQEKHVKQKAIQR